MGENVQLHQLVMNLCANAVFAMKDCGGTLTLQLTECAGGELPECAPSQLVCQAKLLHLEVIDCGTGIDSEAMQQIYEPFFTTKVAGEGTGLGLAVVHGIVTAHGGFIEISSSSDQGTCFDVYFSLLPASDSLEQVSEPEAVAPPVLAKSPNRHLLLVDDEADIVHIQRRMLEHFGFTVASFTDSRAALSCFRQTPLAFDLVVTDQNMPNLSGMAFFEKVRGIRADIPIVLVTGCNSAALEERTQ